MTKPVLFSQIVSGRTLDDDEVIYGLDKYGNVWRMNYTGNQRWVKLPMPLEGEINIEIPPPDLF